MVASRESFSSLQTTNCLSIHMGDDTQIQDEGKGSIKLKHGVFRNVLYLPSLAANLLSVYHMTHIVPLKRVVFGPDSVEISYISTGNVIEKGVAKHSSKAYELSLSTIISSNTISTAIRKGS